MNKTYVLFSLISICTLFLNASEQTQKTTPESDFKLDHILAMRGAIACHDVAFARAAFSPDIFMHDEQSYRLMQYMRSEHDKAQTSTTIDGTTQYKIFEVHNFLMAQLHVALGNAIESEKADAAQFQEADWLITLGKCIHGIEHQEPYFESTQAGMEGKNTAVLQATPALLKKTIFLAKTGTIKSVGGQALTKAVIDGNQARVKMCLKQKISPLILCKKHPHLPNYPNALIFAQKKAQEAQEKLSRYIKNQYSVHMFKQRVRIWQMLEKHADIIKIRQEGANHQPLKKVIIFKNQPPAEQHP